MRNGYRKRKINVLSVFLVMQLSGEITKRCHPEFVEGQFF